MPASPPTPAARPAPPPRAAPATWQLTSLAPADWADALAACGATFFHAPPALEVSLPPGEPVYARLVAGARTLAVALGVAARCRLSRRARHVRFAALPAAAPGVDRARAAAGLARLLAERGMAEVVMESFGARGEAGPAAGGLPGRARLEFVLPLAGGADDLLMRMRGTHRRRVRHGQRAGWRMRVLRGDEALRLLSSVRETASERAAARGDGFDPGAAEAPFGRAAERKAPWGVATFGAFDGGVPLAAAAMGWGGGSSYFLSGGSTPEGYQQSAAHWLQWRALAELAAAGITHHNLGGVPGDAWRPDHPSHGLYEYKSGYGADPAPCRGVRWEPGTRHLRLHAWWARLGGGR